MLWLVGFSGIAMAKPSIAVLGLEVTDQSGTPTAADTQAAKELSDGLRARAKAGTGPYQLAPASDKELIDQKLLNNCDNEAHGCMSAIGNQLGADVLMYGHVEKQGKNYQITLRVLDVGRKKELRSTTELIPVAEASGAALQGWAKRLYARLTGESSGGTVVVKVSNANRGTILVDGEPRGSFSEGSGSVSGVDGKVRIGVESEGFRRWEKDIDIRSGSQTIPVELEKASGDDIVTPPPCTGPDCEDVRRPRGGSKSNLTWQLGTGAGVLVMGLGVYIMVDHWGKAKDQALLQCQHGVDRKDGGLFKADIDDCAGQRIDTLEKWEDGNPDLDASNAEGNKQARYASYGWGVAAIGLAITGVSVYKWVTSDKRTSREGQSGRRVRKNRTFVVTPVMGRQGGGATLRIDW